MTIQRPDLRPQRALVTGGAGFIGSHIAHNLHSQGWAVRILDDLSTGTLENLKEILDEIEIIEGSVAVNAEAERAVADVDCVFHQAAIPSVQRSIRDPMETFRVTLGGTVNMLEAARAAGARRFVFAASSAVYGDDLTLPKTESMKAGSLSPYGVAKHAGEECCRIWQDLYGMETMALRYFNVFGPRQNPDSEYAAVIPKFIMALLQDREIIIFGTGEQSRDFVYIDNIVEANLKAATCSEPKGEVMNIAGGQQITLNQLAVQLGAIIGVEPRIRYVERRPGDIEHSYADIERAAQLIGYNPSVSFKRGLELTVAYYKDKVNYWTSPDNVDT